MHGRFSVYGACIELVQKCVFSVCMDVCAPLIHGGLSMHGVHSSLLGELHGWLGGNPHHHVLLLRIGTLLHHLEARTKKGTF